MKLLKTLGVSVKANSVKVVEIKGWWWVLIPPSTYKKFRTVEEANAYIKNRDIRRMERSSGKKILVTVEEWVAETEVGLEAVRRITKKEDVGHDM